MRKFNVTVNGVSYEVEVEEVGGAQPAKVVQKAESTMKEQPKTKVKAAPEGGTEITAPMPGNVVKIVAKDGATVKKGDVLFVLEAMKMENDIVATADGKISVNVSEGEVVSSGDTLAVIA